MKLHITYRNADHEEMDVLNYSIIGAALVIEMHSSHAHKKIIPLDLIRYMESSEVSN